MRRYRSSNRRRRASRRCAGDARLCVRDHHARNRRGKNSDAPFLMAAARGRTAQLKADVERLTGQRVLSFARLTDDGEKWPVKSLVGFSSCAALSSFWDLANYNGAADRLRDYKGPGDLGAARRAPSWRPARAVSGFERRRLDVPMSRRAAHRDFPSCRCLAVRHQQGYCFSPVHFLGCFSFAFFVRRNAIPREAGVREHGRQRHPRDL